MRPAQCVWLFGAWGLLVLGGCSDKKSSGGGGAAASVPTGNGTVTVKQSTAKDAVETYLLARAQFDVDAIGQIVPPDYQKPCKTLAGCLGDLLKKQQELADAAEAKFDKPLAARIRGRIKDVNASDRDFLDNGHVPWAKIRIDEHGDKAAATVAGRDGPLNLVRLAGKWYVLPPEFDAGGPEHLGARADRMKADFAQTLAAMDGLIARVKAGRATRQELEDIATTQRAQ